MKDTVKAMLESEFQMPMSIEEANMGILESITPISDKVRELTGFTPEKAVVLYHESEGRYYIEFANNIERVMKDQNISFIEAVEEILNTNNIHMEDTSIIVDESCISKLDLSTLVEHEDITVCRK